jgi:hypothetical protein
MLPDFSNAPDATAAYQRVTAKKTSSGSGGTITERLLSDQQRIINSATSALDAERSTSTDEKANPDTYRSYLSKYIAAGGVPSDFYGALDLENYISTPNRKGNLIGTNLQYNVSSEQQKEARLQELNQKLDNGTITDGELIELYNLQ